MKLSEGRSVTKSMDKMRPGMLRHGKGHRFPCWRMLGEIQYLMDSMVRVSGFVMRVMVSEPNGRFIQGVNREKKAGMRTMLKEAARVWSIRFPAAPESTNAVETVHGQSTSASDTKKGLAESDEDIGATHTCPRRWKLT